MAAEVLTTAGLAKRLGIGKNTALRMLRDMHERYGDMVVSKRGNRYVTTEASLATVRTEASSCYVFAALKDMQERMSAVEDRLSKIERAIGR